MLKEYKTLLPYMKKYRWSYVAGLLSLVVTSGGQLFIPQFIRRAVDEVGQGEVDLAVIGQIALGMIAVALVIGIGRFGWRYFIHGSSRRIEMELRGRLFDHFMSLSSGFFARNKIGDLMARSTNDMQHIRMASGMALVAATDGIFMTVAILVILFSQNPRLALLSILPLPVITLIIIFMGRLLGKLFKRVQEGFSTISQQAQEVFTGIRVVKSFVKESYFLRKFQQANEDYQSRNMRLVRLWGLFFPLVTFLSGLTSLILLRVGGESVILREISTGELVATLNYLEMLVWPMLGAGFTVNMIQRGGAALQRINEILNEEPEIQSPLEGIRIAGRPTSEELARGPNGQGSLVEARGAISVRNLTYSYPDADEPVLHDISFEVEAGEILGILGRTGSGKTTLIRLLPRLLNPPPGAVFLDGRDVRDYDLASLRSMFGFVPQDTFLFSASLKDNISFGMRHVNDDIVQRSAEISTITRDMAEFPSGWLTEVGERGITLSGGQKQRIAISRALAAESEILVFDDALSAVDTETEEKILDELLTYRRGKTSLIVSHRVSTLQAANRIIVLDQGRIVQSGRHEELVAEDGFYQEIFNLQQLSEEGGI
jgi:ATP-binding cassette subfamily B protein